MKIKKYIIGIICILLSLSFIACSSGNNLSIEDVLELNTREDVTKRLGESTPPDYIAYYAQTTNETVTSDYFNITFMKRKCTMQVSYEQDVVSFITIEYPFESLTDDNKFSDEYQPSSEDIDKAEKFMQVLVDSLKEKYGEPKIYDESTYAKVTSFSWDNYGNEIEVNNYIQDKDYWNNFAIQITFDS